MLRPALIDAGIAINRGTAAKPKWEYQGVAFHAFRKACGSLLFSHGKTLKQVQGWLRHSQLTTTMNIYINQVDDGLGSADGWDDILGPVAPSVAPDDSLEDKSPANTHGPAGI